MDRPNVTAPEVMEIEFLVGGLTAPNGRLELASLLEDHCHRELELHNRFRRKAVQVPGSNLGEQWQGALAFVLNNVAQLEALCRALHAFAVQFLSSPKPFRFSVKLTSGDTQVEIESDHADLKDIDGIRRRIRQLRKDLAREGADGR